jgi:predicted alpha/beta hydrolase family esterase
MRSIHVAVLMGACCGSLPGTLFAGKPPGREDVRHALASVDRWLATSQHAQGWHRHLQTDELRQELSKSHQPDREVLEKVLARLSDEAPGLESPRLIALRHALQGWLVLETLPHARHFTPVMSSILQSPPQHARAAARLVSTNTATNPPRSDELRAHLVALAAMIAHYGRRPTDELARSIDAQLNWLATAREADTLVEAVRHYYAHPNIWIDISEDVLDDPVTKTVERREAVSDVILGTPLSGNGKLRAESDLVIEPDVDRAILKIVVQGDIETQTIGTSGPARIHARAVTSFRAQKQLVLDGSGLKVLPTECTAETRTIASNVSAVTGGLRGRIVRRVGARRWEASRDAADQEAARHVEQRVRAEVDRQADDLIKRLDRLAIAPMLALSGGDPSKTRVRFCTEKKVLRIGVVRGPLGAPPGRPPTDEGRLFAVRIHASLINRFADVAWQNVVTSNVQSTALTLLTPIGALENADGAAFFEFADFLRTVAGPAALSPLNQATWRKLIWRGVENTLRSRLTGDGLALGDGRRCVVSPPVPDSQWFQLDWQVRQAERLSSLPNAARR